MTRPCLWVHVSTLMRWDGAPVGIVRAEREYCRWLLAQDTDPRLSAIRFCVFDRQRGVFSEVDAKAVHDRLGGGAREPTAGPVLALPESVFAPADHFVSLGLDWDHLDMDVLHRLRLALGLRITMMCYDTIPLQFPHLCCLAPGLFQSYLHKLALCSDRVLCISENTRRDFRNAMQVLGLEAPATRVVRLGADIYAAGVPQRPACLGEDPRPFVLFVSTIERRKNHDILYRAWVRMREQGRTPHRLVFVGMPAWGVTDLLGDIRGDPRIANDIVCLERVDDAQLCWLYKKASFTVFPSLYEGWGLPVIESLAWGKFCLASDRSSIPEAGGPWVEYLDPWDLEALVRRLTYFMDQPEELERRNERIASEFKVPVWADTARDIHEAAVAAPSAM